MKRTLYTCFFCAASLTGLPAAAQTSPPVGYALHRTGSDSPPPQGNRRSLASVLLELERKYNASIAYRSELVRDKIVETEANSFSSLDEALGFLLKGHNLKFKKIKPAVYVISAAESPVNEIPKAKEKTLLNESPDAGVMPIQTLPQLMASRSSKLVAAVVSGTVSEQGNGQAIPGVTVLLKGTTLGTTTDEKGHFSLNLPQEDGTLVFSAIGFVAQEVPVGNRSVINVSLVADIKSLGEVVVIGYGTTNRRDLTGSVSSISEAEIKATPITSLDQALQGRAAGVQVITSSGAPGAPVTVRVRGTGSIGAGSEPLYVVDGFPLYNDNGEANPAGISGVQNGNGQNALAALNPNDIESIEVLKDASATAIYGARGANGVVLITTKRGKAGQNNVDFQSYFGIQNLSRARPIFDPVEYAEYRAEQAANNNLAPEAWRGLNIDWNFLDSVRTAGTDWQKETFRAAPIQNYQLNFSGGTEKVRYSLGGGYFNQQGIIVNSKFDRYSLRVNLDADLNKRLKVGNNLTVAYTTTHGVATENEGGGGGASRGVVSSVFQQSPLAPVFVTEANNRLFPLQQPGDYADPNSPLAIATGRKNITNTTRLLGDIFADFKILEGLSYRLKVGASITDARRNVFFPSTTDVGNNARGRASIGSTNSINWLTESILSYNKTFFDRHNLNVVGVYSLQKNSFQSVNGEAQGFVNDVLEEYNMGAGLIRTTGSSAGDFSFKSYTGRLNYNYNQKYLFTFTTRVDGSSRFGKGNKYAVFPSAAVAWRLSDEQFMQGLNYFNDFKIRASYGITGNSEIGGYKSLNRFGPTNYTFNRLEVSGIAPFQVANDELRWEKTRQFDIGVDVSVFSNRLTLVADYYHKVTDDLLLDIDLPLYSGYGRGTVNIGSLENKGVELAILTQNLVGEFTWSTNFNISRNRNKVTKLNNADQINVGFTGGDVIKSNNSNIALIKVGYPLGAYYGAVYEGVWRDLAQIEEVGTNLNARPGQERFRDTNGDGIVNNEDFAMIGNGQPDVALGFTNNFAYKGFGLSIFMTGMLGYDIYNFARTRGESTQGGENKFRSLLNRWTIDNPDARYPYAGYAVFDGSSSKYIEKGDYLRIKNITLSYNLPGGLASWLRSARVFVSGDNLFTFTEYTGYDPEVNSRGGSATANTVMGLDMNAYPAVKIYRLGVDIGF